MPTISIITPSLNQGAFFGECLGSVREAASFAGLDVEHVVIDGGSSDNTLDILRGQDSAIWVSEPDNGQTDAINKGIRMTSAGIVSYLCADDMLERGSLKAVHEAFSRNPGVDVVYGDAYFLEEGWKRRKHAGPFSVGRLRRGNFLLQPAVFLRRKVFETHGLFDAELRFCMDHEFWLRICRDTHWTQLSVPLASCRLHSAAKTWRQLPAAWDEARRMQARYGIYWRPLRDAFWMRTLGSHYYRFKRSVFSRVAKARKK